MNDPYELQQGNSTFLNVSGSADLDVVLTKKRPPSVEIQLRDSVGVGDYDRDESNRIKLPEKLARAGITRYWIRLRFGSQSGYEALLRLYQQLGDILADPAWNKIKKALEEEAKNQEAIDLLDRIWANKGDEPDEGSIAS